MNLKLNSNWDHENYAMAWTGAFTWELGVAVSVKFKLNMNALPVPMAIGIAIARPKAKPNGTVNVVIVWILQLGQCHWNKH